MGDRRPAAARSRQRVGEHGPAGGRAEGRRGLAHRAWVGWPDRRRPAALVASGHDQPAGFAPDVRRPFGAGAPVRRQLAVGRQRLAQREVEVHHSGAALERCPVSAAGERAHPAQPLGRCVVHADLEEPLGGAAEQLQLVDRLPGAHLAQLRRPVGAEQQQRHACLLRLDRRRQQLGGGRARGAGHRHRQPRSLGQPQREEARAALIDVRVAA